MNISTYPNAASRFGLMALLLALMAVVPVQAQSRYAYSTDGSEVTDAQTGLVWRRCTAGQAWNTATSVCAGAGHVFNHEEALSYAQTQTGWRLPNVKELGSLVDVKRTGPAMDTVAFPGTANVSYWSSTPDVQLPSSAWSVDFLMGNTNSTGRNTFGLLVRLVR